MRGWDFIHHVLYPREISQAHPLTCSFHYLNIYNHLKKHIALIRTFKSESGIKENPPALSPTLHTQVRNSIKHTEHEGTHGIASSSSNPASNREFIRKVDTVRFFHDAVHGLFEFPGFTTFFSIVGVIIGTVARNILW